MSDLDILLALRGSMEGEVLNFQQLMSALQDYVAPRDVITRWLEDKYLLRVKKGVYIFGEKFSKRSVHLEILANQLYGPSYVSLEYALQIYGLIPEAVYEVTSVTTKRNKCFDTPLGRFTYHHLHVKRYPIGVNYFSLGDNTHALIATQEKALADLLFFKKVRAKKSQELTRLITESYRIEEESLRKFNLKQMLDIAQYYDHPTIHLLPYVLREIQHAS